MEVVGKRAVFFDLLCGISNFIFNKCAWLLAGLLFFV